jgi:hypothetical protein
MSLVSPYKVCPACGAEYRQQATHCADCGADLVSADALAPEPVGAPELPPAADLECVRVAPQDWILALSRALRQEGLGHRIEPARAEDAPAGQRPDVFGSVQLFGLYLPAGQAAAARELDAGIAARLLPEEAPALVPGEQDACPACGAALPADALQCPDCELSFG